MTTSYLRNIGNLADAGPAVPETPYQSKMRFKPLLVAKKTSGVVNVPQADSHSCTQRESSGAKGTWTYVEKAMLILGAIKDRPAFTRRLFLTALTGVKLRTKFMFIYCKCNTVVKSPSKWYAG